MNSKRFIANTLRRGPLRRCRRFRRARLEDNAETYEVVVAAAGSPLVAPSDKSSLPRP